MKSLRQLIQNEDGNIATMFGIVVTFLAVGVGVAIDTTSMHSFKADLQRNIDTAALAAVIELENKDDGSYRNSDNETRAQAYADVVEAHLKAHNFDLMGAKPEVTINDGRLIVNATIKHNLFFGKLLKKPSININSTSEVIIPGVGSPIEVALVLDNTESMNFGGKMTALKQGVREFVDAIEESDSGSKIAFVPFARYVDVGIDNRNELWLDVPEEYDTDTTFEQATHTGGTCNLETQTRFKDGIEEEFETEVCTGQTTTYETTPKVVESRWAGCVGARPDGLHLVDGNYTNSDTKIPGLLQEVPSDVTGYSVDISAHCTHTIIPLTDDYQFLRNRTYWLYGTDRTHIPTGLIWGQRILSPEAPFTEADTVNPKRQIMVLMSDGQNTAYIKESIAGFSHDNYEALPYIEDLDEEEQKAGVIPPNTNEETAALCETIKASGIEIYTIAFQVDDTFTRNLLSNCASSQDNYFNAGTNSKLVQSFKDISGSLESQIRLAR